MVMTETRETPVKDYFARIAAISLVLTTILVGFIVYAIYFW